MSSSRLRPGDAQGPSPPPRQAGAWTLLRGTIWNQLGQILPLLAALGLIPPLIRALGVDRFGVLSLAWMLIGYFTLFDLGVSGALTRLVAERLATRRDSEIPGLVWTALSLTAVMGVIGAAVIAAAAPWLVRAALRVPPELQPETLHLTWVLACSLPVVTGTAALAGVLAAQQRFGILNSIRIPMGILTYAAPLLALRLDDTLLSVGLSLGLVRVLGAAAHLGACLTSVPGLAEDRKLRHGLVRSILSFGGWMTVTAVVSPIMVYLDRFLIGSMLSLAMVAYYTTPYDLAQRFAILAMPVVTVMFPAFAACYDTDRSRAARLFDWSVRSVATLLLPVVVVSVILAPELLTLWLGADFANHSTAVLRLLALGMLLNGMAMVALSFLQSTGRPDLGARLHVLELPVYLLLLWLLIGRLGILGAALVWFLRVAVDAAALFAMAHRRIGPGSDGARTALLVGGGGVALIAAGAAIPGLGWRSGYAAVLLVIFAAAVWRTVVVPGRRILFEARAMRSSD